MCVCFVLFFVLLFFFCFFHYKDNRLLEVAPNKSSFAILQRDVTCYSHVSKECEKSRFLARPMAAPQLHLGVVRRKGGGDTY